MTDTRRIKTGEIVMLSSGEYSDYYVKGLFRAKHDFEPTTIVEEYLQAHPDEREAYSGEFYKFINWLENERQAVEPIDYAEFYMGASGTYGPRVL